MTTTIPARTWLRLGVAFGVGALFSYFFSVVFQIFPWRFGRMLFFAFGPLYALGAYSIGCFLLESCDGPMLRLSILMNVIAGVVVNAMAVVQSTIFTFTRRFLAGAESEAERDLINEVWRGVNSVQLGLDVCWDIWVSLGTATLALALLRLPLPRWLCVAGAAVALSALGLNLWTFPAPPAESGLIDLGPGIGVWYGLLVVALIVRSVRRRDRAGGASA